MDRALNDSGTSLFRDVALACHIDVIQACVLLPRELDGPSIISFVTDISETVYVSSLAFYVCFQKLIFLPKLHLARNTSGPPFYLSPDPINVALYCDAIIALYPRRKEDVLREIMIPALDAHRSYASKLVVIRALIGITIEYKKFDVEYAYQCIRPLYEALAPRILSIYGVSD